MGKMTNDPRATQTAMGIKVKPKVAIKEHGFWLHELSGKSYWGMQLYLPTEGPSVEITEAEHKTLDADRLDLLAIKFPNNEKYKQWAVKRQEEAKAVADAKEAEAAAVNAAIEAEEAKEKEGGE
jgi:hypothetical protein